MRYRRRNEDDVWHFCNNCPNLPRKSFEEKFGRPATGELCSVCQAKLLDQSCEVLAGPLPS
jgi:hypothetical protein